MEKWISILENLYLIFRIAPYGTSRIRAVKKDYGEETKNGRVLPFTVFCRDYLKI